MGNSQKNEFIIIVIILKSYLNKIYFIYIFVITVPKWKFFCISNCIYPLHKIFQSTSIQPETILFHLSTVKYPDQNTRELSKYTRVNHR